MAPEMSDLQKTGSQGEERRFQAYSLLISTEN
jgi:hypothetical protein